MREDDQVAQPPGHRQVRGELEQMLRVLRRRRGLIVLCTILVAAGTLGFSLSQRKEYSSSAELLFRDAQLDQKLFGSTVLPPSTDPAREAATNVKLVSLEAVAARTSKALGGRISPPEVQSKISVDPQGESDVVSVTAVDPSGAFAARLANAFAQQFVAFRRDADRDKIAGAQRLVQNQLQTLSPEERRGPRGRSLQGRAEQLGILASLQTGNAELVQRAKPPSSPSYPRTTRNVVLGLVLGLLLGVGLAFLFERLDRRIKDVRELEEIYGLPVLAAVPESQALVVSQPSGTQLPLAEAEAFRMLRARLRYFNLDRPLRSLLLTSVAPGEGKTTVAQYLAVTAARSVPTRTLLLEADLHRPRLAGRYGLKSAPGLAEVLTHGIALEDVVQHVPLGESGDGADGGRMLDVLVAGADPPNPAELLESEKMAELLKDLSLIYDLIVIDTPPMAAVADSMPLMAQVSGVVVVSEVGSSSRDAAAHLRHQLKRLGAPALGVVANRVKAHGIDDYGYGYYAAEYLSQRPAEKLEEEQAAS